jgi:hypothetical protein
VDVKSHEIPPPFSALKEIYGQERRLQHLGDLVEEELDKAKNKKLPEDAEVFTLSSDEEDNVHVPLSNSVPPPRSLPSDSVTLPPSCSPLSDNSLCQDGPAANGTDVSSLAMEFVTRFMSSAEDSTMFAEVLVEYMANLMDQGRLATEDHERFETEVRHPLLQGAQSILMSSILLNCIRSFPQI